MAIVKLNVIDLEKSEYKGGKSSLCPGCGHDQISNVIIQAAWENGLPPEGIAKMSGIGCSSKTPAYFLGKSHGFNTVHGRMPSVTTGANMVNKDLAFIAVSGDGDTASIGMGQFVHAIRRNLDMVYIIENNGVYGLTKGQYSATVEKGSKKIAALLPKNAYGLLLFDTISKFSQENLIEIKKVEFYEFSIENQRKAAQKISKGFDQYQETLNQLKEQEDDATIDKDEVLIEKPFDSVFIAAAGQNLTVLSSQLQYNNVDPKLVQYLGISSWEDNSILREPALEGGIFVTTSQLYQDKIKLIYKNSFDKEMPKIAMIAYDIVALLGSLEYIESFIDVNNLINDEGYIGLRGLFRLKNNGIVERTFQLKQVKNKKFSTLKKAITDFSGF